MRRRFLFLQGVCSPFFSQLADALIRRGHSAFKLNFSMGDAVYWRHARAWAYRGRREQLDEYLRRRILDEDISDIVLFGDRRAVHEAATRVAGEKGLRIHVFEEGYFRPYWITLEREGVNGHSQLPRDPDFYRAVGPRMPKFDNGSSYPSPFWRRALHDVIYHAAGALNPVAFPGYRTHVPWPIAVEYTHYVLRGARLLRRQRTDAAALASLLGRGQPFFLFPLQLGSDAQIRHHSGFAGMPAAIDYVLRSFAAHAPGDAHLVVKNHPLDCGIDRYEACVRRCVDTLDLQGRVHFVETGNLPQLLSHARGVVTVNSTVGGSALVHRTPLKALGNAIYDLPGLSFQGLLDDFWAADFKPDGRLVRYFRNTVIQTTQINGGFYTRAGIEAAVAGAIPRLEARRSPIEKLMRDTGR